MIGKLMYVSYKHKQNMNLVNFLAIFLIAIVFFFHNLTIIDPDFGFHIRMGELILGKGFPQKDPFSYTMSSYPVVDHEWLIDIFLAKTFPTLGFLGLSAIFSILTLLTIFLVMPRNAAKFFLMPFFLSSAILISFVGIRPQVLTWLFTAILLKILLDKKVWAKFRFLIPLLFLLWANLHGGFVAGLAIYLITILIRSFQKRKVLSLDLLIFFTSIGITLINPYGIRLWGEVWNTVSDNQLRWNIIEWIPILFSINIPFLFFFSISSIFIIKQRKTIDLNILVLFTILSLLTFSSARYAPLWVLIALPQTSYSLEIFFNQIKNKSIALVRFNIFSGFLLSFSLFFLIISVWSNYSVYKNFKQDTSYPTLAINFLKNYSSEGEVFAPYGWGGYLIWKYPQKKVFVDGRMPSWRFNPTNNFESKNAFKEYLDIDYKGGEFQKTFDKYNIKLVLWQKEVVFKPNIIQKIISHLSYAFNNLFFQNKEKVAKSLISRLEEAGWKKIYEDETSIIYQQ